MPGRSRLWFKEETRTSEGANYYAYLLLSVDDCLVIHHAKDKSLHEFDHFFKMKSGSIGNPNMFLVANFRKVVLETEFKHGILVNRSMCRRMFLIQRIIFMSILGAGSLQKRLLIHLSLSMIH